MLAHNAACLPEVGVHGPIGGVEQPHELAKLLVLAVVELLVDRRGRTCERGVVQRGGHIRRCEYPRREREVYTGREERVDEAGGIARQDPAVAHHIT